MASFLYDLIKSLTTSEKVYFKRNARIHAGNEKKNYLEIYNAIEKQGISDNTQLAGHFGGTTIEKYLSSEANYLKEKILLSLFNYDLNGTKRNQIQKAILLIEVLTKKGFRKEALKKLKATKKNAFREEEFTMVLRLIELEEIILFKEGIIGYKDKLQQLYEERNSVTNTIQNLNDYHILREEIRELQFSVPLDTEIDNRFEDLRNNVLVQKSENCLSIRAREHWYYIQVLLNYLERDFEAGLSISIEYVDFMQQNMHLFDQSKILPVLSNYIYHGALTRNKVQFERAEKMLLEIARNEGVSPFYIRYILCSRNLEFSYYANDIQLMKDYLHLTRELLENEKEHFEEAQIQYLFMLTVRSTIVLEEDELAMEYINKWFQNGVLSHRKVQARLFSIMIHFKLNYFELIQSEIILLKKLEKQNKREKKLINAFYKYFNSYIKHPSKRALLTEKFQNELQSISLDNKGYFDFNSFDYHRWSMDI